jgi:hypothetical protein
MDQTTITIDDLQITIRFQPSVGEYLMYVMSIQKPNGDIITKVETLSLGSFGSLGSSNETIPYDSSSHHC